MANKFDYAKSKFYNQINKNTFYMIEKYLKNPMLIENHSIYSEDKLQNRNSKVAIQIKCAEILEGRNINFK